MVPSNRASLATPPGAGSGGTPGRLLSVPPPAVPLTQQPRRPCPGQRGAGVFTCQLQILRGWDGGG